MEGGGGRVFLERAEFIVIVYSLWSGLQDKPESEFNEFEWRLKSAKNRFQFSASLNFEKLNTI